jgi:hypothetical protein
VVSNKQMPRLLLTLASCLTASVFAVTLVAQRGTDFSGSWVLDETQGRPAPDIPQRLVVEHRPDSHTLDVKRHLGSVIQEDAYRIGLIGGVVAALPARGDPPGSGGGSRYEVTWRGDSRGDFLWIYRETHGASGENIRRRGEAWRIDDLGRLVISIETREKDGAAATQTLVYRKDKK